MKTVKIIYALTCIFFILFIHSSVNCQSGFDLVNGNLVQFNNNGAWCWYQDERVVVDTIENKIIFGSDASGSGTGGNSSNGKVEGGTYDPETGKLRISTFRNAGCDDHNVPGFIIRPDGQYLAMYADHYDQWNSRYRIFDGSEWSEEEQFDWTTIPGGTDYTIAYSNLYFLSEEDRMYNFARANHRCPNFIVSDNQGDTWLFGGQLTTNTSSSYNKGYYKYWSNGIDRIDFIFTEQHPRDTSTSIFHGYLINGRTYTSDGTLADNDIYDLQIIPSFHNFTKVFADNTIIGENAMRRCWNADVMRYNDGTIATIVTARINDNQGGGSSAIDPDHAFIYCRYDGTDWNYTYLGEAGKKLYASEQDYTGLGALHPNNPDIVYISTPIDPRDNSQLPHREIFKGVTNDEGGKWSWTSVTWNSSRDNYRPVVPLWDTNSTALLWMRGTYYTAQIFDMTIVGIIENSSEGAEPMKYTDASASNTTLADGSGFNPTGPDANAGLADDQWHEHTGYGNEGSLYTSSEVEGEDAPAIKTTVKTNDTGTFDVWVNFWADPESDWRIKAGLQEDDMQIFRHMACKQVEEGDHNTVIEIAGNDNTYLYQAYLGRIETNADSTFEVYVDDHAIQTGTSFGLTGNEERTWYDGISYTKPLYLYVSDAELEVENTSGSTTSFEISSNTAWNVTSSESWLNADPSAGSDDHTVELTADENPEDTSRLAIITIHADNIQEKTIKVFQKPGVPILSVSASELTVAASENSEAVFDIVSNTYWQVSGSGYWLHADPKSGMNNKTITLTADVNHTDAPRAATITVTAEGLAPQLVTVTQEANLLLAVSKKRLNIGAETSSTNTFDIESNTDWTISRTEEWLSPNILEGTGNASVILTAEENPENTTRNAIVVVSAEGVADQRISVKQAANPVESIEGPEENIGYIFPNPVKDKLNVKLFVLPAQLKLYTYEGKQVLNMNTVSTVTEIDLTNLNKGIYVLQIVSEEQTFIRKLVKQ